MSPGKRREEWKEGRLKDDGSLQRLEQSVAVEKCLYFLFIVGGFVRFPVEQIFSAGVPRYTIE